MHVHELNPWRTLIVVSGFVIVLLIGFLTMSKPIMTYQLDMNQSLEELTNDNAYFYPWELDSFVNHQGSDIVLFDIRDNFVFGQGHIPGAENMSANNLTQEENIERLEELKEKNVTVVLYGDDQLQANGPWMLFRQVGFDNVKILVGGYKYYLQHKDDLASTIENYDYMKGIPQYDFADMAKSEEGAGMSSTDQKPVQVQRRQKTQVASGGC